MELNTISLNVFVQLANVIFEKQKDAVEANMRKSGLFTEEFIPQGSGNIRQFTQIDRNRYAHRKAESDQATRAKVQQGYSVNVVSYRVANDIGISYEMRTQNKYSDVIDSLTSLGSQAAEKMELDLSHRIGFGTATSYTDMDGVTVDLTTGDTFQLFYTAHTVKGSSTTYRNRLANNPQVARGSIELMEKNVVEQSMNQFGEKIRIPFDLIWTTDDPNTINTVSEYLKSISSPDAINSGVTNVYNGKYRHIVLPLVATDCNGLVDSTKAKYWGLASTMHTSAHLLVWEESHLKTPSEGNNGEDFASDDWNFGVRGGYGMGILDGFWIHMSSGDGTA